MKNFITLCCCWFLGISIAVAEIPKAGLTATVVDNQQWPAQFNISLDVPADHHAYLNAGDDNIYIPVAIDPKHALASEGLAIDKLEAPAGVYDAEVKAQVLRGLGDFKLWLRRDNTAGATPKAKLALNVSYQLCNEITHVCFRPQTGSVELLLPTPPAQTLTKTAEPTTAPAATDFSGQILEVFKNNQDSVLIMFALMFLAGLLSVATPCVYPMLPITSMFIVNRANGVVEKEKQHAFVYLLGIIGTYMLLGLAAGMTGGAFNTLMQSAWINILFAGFFAFFALSLLGFYELGIMQNEVHSLDQHSAQVKGLTGTWLMGTVAGLVISPCVGPIVFALLLQVADNIALKAESMAAANQAFTFWDKLGIASQGSVMMAGFGLGVGLPFFLVSVIKFKKLPKAGYWMNKIKYGFGFAILYFAFTYLEKGLGVMGVAHETTLLLAIGLAVVWFAVVHCNVLTFLPADAQPNQKMYHYFGVIALILGVWLVVGSLGQLPIMQSAQAKTPKLLSSLDCPVASADSKPALIEEEAGIPWHRTYAAALEVAQNTHKPIFIDFYASWCANCVAFKAETANNPELNRALRENAVALKLVDKEPEFETFRANPEHRQLKIGLPYFAILSSAGKLIWSGTDYKASEQMIAVLHSNS